MGTQSDSERPQGRSTPSQVGARLSPEATLQNVGWVRSLALCLVGYSIQADDVAQETWIRVLRNPPPDGVPFRKWVRGTMRRVVLEQSRKATARKDNETAAGKERLETTPAQFEEQVAIERDIVEHVMSLKEPLRRTVMLKYFDRLTVKDIAQAEGTSSSAIKTRLSRAYEELRERMRSHPTSAAGAWLAFALPGQVKVAAASGVSAPFSLLSFNVFVMAKLALVAAALLGIGLFAFTSLRSPGAVPEVGELANAAVPETEVLASEDLGPGSEAREPGRQSAGTLPSVEPIGLEEPLAEVDVVPAGIPVQVVNAQGDPLAGIPLRVGPANERLSIPGHWRGVSAADGFALIELAALDTPYPIRDQTLAVSVESFGSQAASLRFKCDALPSDGLTLVVREPFGTVRISCVDADGAPLSCPATLTVTTDRSSFDALRITYSVEAGEILDVPCIGLGVPLKLMGEIDPSWLACFRTAAGPVRAGEVVSCELEFVYRSPAFSGRVVDDGGQPVAAEGVYDARFITENGGENTTNRGDVEVGTDGRFVAGVRGALLEPGLEGTLEITHHPVGGFGASRENLRIARRDVVIPPRGEPKDVGDMVLESDLPRIEGRVVFPDGEPAKGAIVYLYEHKPLIAKLGWARMNELKGTSDKDGRFSIPVPELNTPRAIQAVLFGRFVSPLLPLNSASESPLLRLERSADISGRVKLPEGLSPTGLHVKIVGTSEASLAAFQSLLGEDGSFHMKNMLPSTVDLELSYFGSESPLATLNGVRVSGETPDPAISPWDLTERVELVECQVTLPGDLGDGFISAFCERQFFAAEGGKIVLVVGDLESLVTIRSAGYRELRCKARDLDPEVALRPALSVELTIDASRTAAAELNGLVVSLYYADARPWEEVRDDTALGHDDWLEAMSQSQHNPTVSVVPNVATTLPVHRPGEFRLEFFQRVGKKGFLSMADEDLPEVLRGLRDLRVNVEDRSGPQPVLVTLR